MLVIHFVINLALYLILDGIFLYELWEKDDVIYMWTMVVNYLLPGFLGKIKGWEGLLLF